MASVGPEMLDRSYISQSIGILGIDFLMLLTLAYSADRQDATQV